MLRESYQLPTLALAFEGQLHTPCPYLALDYTEYYALILVFFSSVIEVKAPQEQI